MVMIEISVIHASYPLMAVLLNDEWACVNENLAKLFRVKASLPLGPVPSRRLHRKNFVGCTVMGDYWNSHPIQAPMA